MDSSQLPMNAMYTPEGAITFIKAQRTKQVEDLDTKIKSLEDELQEMKTLLKEVLNERSK